MRGADVVPLPAKALDALLVLAGQAGRVVTKDELLRRLWPESIVEESNLTQTVYLLRQALGESVKDRRYVVTVPKRGYCFVADLQVAEEGRGARREAVGGDRGAHATAIDAEALELCAKGRFFWRQRTAASLDRAIRFFEAAIRKDGSCAAAYAGLADAYAILSHCSRLSPRQTMPRAKAAALQALYLDDTLVEAHASLALVCMLYDWDWAGAEREFRRALALDGTYATAHHWYGLWLAARARFDAALAALERARRLDPVSPAITSDLGLVLYLARRYDEALAAYRSALELDPGFVDAQEGALLVTSAMGLYARPGDWRPGLPGTFSRQVVSRLEAAYAEAGVRGYWRAYLELAEAPASEVRSSPYVRARIHAQLGETDAALRWLETALAERDGGLSLLPVDPGLDALRREPRYRAVVERVGLAGAG
jgi:DNA-binding winged helix-turn-helix (wHTH) protein/tetratricopeptide (TPR) repeat protein